MKIYFDLKFWAYGPFPTKFLLRFFSFRSLLILGLTFQKFWSLQVDCYHMNTIASTKAYRSMKERLDRLLRRIARQIEQDEERPTHSSVIDICSQFFE